MGNRLKESSDIVTWKLNSLTYEVSSRITGIKTDNMHHPCQVMQQSISRLHTAYLNLGIPNRASTTLGSLHEVW